MISQSLPHKTMAKPQAQAMMERALVHGTLRKPWESMGSLNGRSVEHFFLGISGLFMGLYDVRWDYDLTVSD